MKNTMANLRNLSNKLAFDVQKFTTNEIAKTQTRKCDIVTRMKCVMKNTLLLIIKLFPVW